ncbi:MAG: ECF transporter S component [Candidatus Nanopelagicales bacterium]
MSTHPAASTKANQMGTATAGRVDALHLSRRSGLAIAATSAVGLLAFVWPMVAARGSEVLAHATDAPAFFGLLVPLLLGVTLSLVADGTMGAKAVALLGMLAGISAALRAVGTGIAGLEPIWIVVVLGGYALGAGFGFVLGAVCLIASAMLTGGVGPWLPFQMIAAAWVGLGAGMLPRRLPGRFGIGLLAAYSTIAAVAYGWLLNLWFWPTMAGLPEAIAFAPGAGAQVNLQHWFMFNLATSLGYDIPRAVLTCTAILLVGRRVLTALNRAARVAAFDAQPAFAVMGSGPGPG